MSKLKNPKTSSYYVTVKAVIRRVITVENCTREQAENEPYEHATDELETEQIDYEVESVQEKKD